MRGRHREHREMGRGWRKQGGDGCKFCQKRRERESISGLKSVMAWQHDCTLHAWRPKEHGSGRCERGWGVKGGEKELGVKGFSVCERQKVLWCVARMDRWIMKGKKKTQYSSHNSAGSLQGEDVTVPCMFLACFHLGFFCQATGWWSSLRNKSALWPPSLPPSLSACLCLVWLQGSGCRVEIDIRKCSASE